jgi:hypothetical protein
MWAMQVADPADVAKAANVANPANVANGVFRQAAVPPRRDAAVLLWAALLRAVAQALTGFGRPM